MSGRHLAAASDAAIVSCDIVRHSSAEFEQQISRVAALNAIVAEVIQTCGEETVWASGGDGGHVLFRQAGWHSHAIELIARLRQWSIESQVPLRVPFSATLTLLHSTKSSSSASSWNAGITRLSAGMATTAIQCLSSFEVKWESIILLVKDRTGTPSLCLLSARER